LLAQNKLNIDDVRYEDALGLEILALAFNDMKANLQCFIDLTKGNIITISEAIESVSKSMDNSYKGNEQITASMVNVSEKAQDQAKLMGDTMAMIDEVKNRIENITNSIKEVENSVEKTVQATNAGVQNLDDYNNQVNVISDNLNSTSEYIKRLSSDITQIDQIGKFIIKISEQLKLLGLNASVEAAKAGESGKGFAVVAHEMNLLSAATKESIGQINTILQNISHSSEFASKSIDSCVKSYDVSKDIFSSVRKSFDIINNNASLLEVDMKKVYSDVSLINTSTHEINRKSLLLYNVSGEISSKTQEVAAVTQESLTELQEVNSYTSSLQNMLKGIERLVKKFHTAVTPVEADSKSQLRITLISPLDNGFWYLIRQGVLYAIKELSDKNVLIDYVGIKEDVGTQIKKSFKEAIEKGVDGIIVPGFDPGIVELIEVAYQKNIPVMIYHFDLQKESKRVAYCGPDFNAIGAIAANLMAKALNGKGDIALFFGNDTIVEKTGREVTLSEIRKYKGIKVVADYQCSDNIELSYNTAKDLLRQKQNLRGMIVSEVGLQGIARAIEELGYVGKIPVVTFNFNYEISEYIKKGIVYSTMIHDPFSQGHDPIIHLYNMLVTGQKPESENIWTRYGIINKNNLNDFI
jgi:methyl-accepting chemotaxis protein/ABC-type sugar transport system substrate-binding protein